VLLTAYADRGSNVVPVRSRPCDLWAPWVGEVQENYADPQNGYGQRHAETDRTGLPDARTSNRLAAAGPPEMRVFSVALRRRAFLLRVNLWISPDIVVGISPKTLLRGRLSAPIHKIDRTQD
jgi:hypothetical protein